MSVTVVVFEPGEVLRCVATLSTGNPCRKQFGMATQRIAVALASPRNGGDMVHRCRGCHAELAIYLGVVWTGRAA
jgi:hypothetical protein